MFVEAQLRRFGLLLQVLVEYHCDVAQQQASGGRHPEGVAAHDEQPVGFHLLQFDHLAREMFVEVDGENRFEAVEVELAVAHDRFDHAAAQTVFGVEADAAPDGQLTLSDRVLPRLDVLDVLGVSVADLADRTDAEPHEVAATARGIALEIALQFTVTLGAVADWLAAMPCACLRCVPQNPAPQETPSLDEPTPAETPVQLYWVISPASRAGGVAVLTSYE